MRFARVTPLLAALVCVAAPAAATSAEEPPPDIPAAAAEGPYPRFRGGLAFGVGFAYAGRTYDGPEIEGPTAQFSFRAGKRFNHLVSVYGQGSALLLWHRADPRGFAGSSTTLRSEVAQSSALVAFTLEDRVELAVGPALDFVFLNHSDQEEGLTNAYLSPGLHFRPSVTLYRTRDTDRAPMGLVLGMDVRVVVPVLPPDEIPIFTVSAGLGWEWY